MLIQFNFKNHKCFYEKSTLDMTATNEKRHLSDTIDINGNKLLPFVSIYGSNASGKSTIIDAFFSMTRLVVRSFDSDLFEPFIVIPFAFNEKTRNEPSEFEIFLNVDNYEYRYGFIADKDRILEEWLYKKIFKKGTKAKEKLLFEREKNEVCYGTEYKEAEQVETLISEKSLLLSVLGRREIGIAKNIYKWFLNNYGISEQSNYISESVIKLLYENQRIRYGVSGLHLDSEDNEKTYRLPIHGESSGTRKSIKVLPIILKCLIEGNLLFIDELDTQMHPLLLKKIVYMFSDKEINKNNAQLVYTTHNTYMFNSRDMRRDQILLVEKEKNGKSKLYSLSDFKKLRIGADYEKKYLSGEFGAIPFIRNW